MDEATGKVDKLKVMDRQVLDLKALIKHRVDTGELTQALAHVLAPNAPPEAKFHFPRNHGLAKTHKAGTPYRGVTSMTGTAYRALQDYVLFHQKDPRGRDIILVC